MTQPSASQKKAVGRYLAAIHPNEVAKRKAAGGSATLQDLGEYVLQEDSDIFLQILSFGAPR